MAISPELAKILTEHAPDIAAVVLLVLAAVISFAVAVYRRHREYQRFLNAARFPRQTEIDEKLLEQVPAVDMGTMLFPKTYTPVHKALSQENLLMNKT